MKMVKLNQLCEINIGKTPARAEISYWGRGEKWISIADLKEKHITTTKEQITELAIEECNMKKIPKNTVIMSFKLTIGKVAITGEDAYSNEAIANFPILDKEKLIPEYLYYALKTVNFLGSTDRAVMGATLNKAKLNEVKIPLADIVLQRAIVEILDKAQGLIDKRKEQIEACDELIKSQFIEMFGKCTEKRRLEEYTTLITKGSSPKWQGFDYCDEGTLFVTSENVREGYLDFTKTKYLPDEVNSVLTRSVLKRNDILINIVNASIGRAAIFDRDDLANINQAVALVRIKPEEINLSFLLAFLNSEEAIKAYDFMKVGGDKANLSLKNIADLMIPVADISVQNEFAQFVQQVDKLKFEMEQSLVELEDNFSSLMQRAFKGELLKETN